MSENKVIKFIRDVVEIVIPVIALVVLFLTFCFQVFMRYIVRAPQAWTTEVEQSCFLWLVMFGACYAQRLKGHVTFTLVYDNLKLKGKAISAMLGNILICFSMLVTFVPSLNYIVGLLSRSQVTTLLKWQKAYVFFPYVIFLIFIFLYSFEEIYEEIQVLKGNQKYIDKMVQDSKSEAEQAIEDALNQEQIDLTKVTFDEEEEKK